MYLRSYNTVFLRTLSLKFSVAVIPVYSRALVRARYCGWSPSHPQGEQLSPLLLLCSHKATGTCGTCPLYKSPSLRESPVPESWDMLHLQAWQQVWHGHWVQVWPDMYMGPAQEVHHWRDSGKAVWRPDPPSLSFSAPPTTPPSLFSSSLYFSFSLSLYILPCVCMCNRVMHSVASVICMYNVYFLCVNKKQAVYCLTAWKSPTGYNYSTTFFLSKNASSVVCYVQWAVQTEQFILF